MKKLIKKIQGHFYLYDWIKPIICRFSGHSIVATFQIYQQEKIIKSYDKRVIKLIKHRYDPYAIFHCERCGKRLRVKRLAQQLTREEAEKFNKERIEKFKAKI